MTRPRATRSPRRAPRRRPKPAVAVVLVTVPDAGVAERIARTLVSERLIACANIIPGVRSIYTWKGALCDEGELLLVLKTRATAFERLKARLVALHPYEVPEVLRLDVAQGHAPYLAWLFDSVPA